MLSRSPSSGLLVRQEEPFNAGTAPSLLAGSFLTPQPALYVRSHGNVPRIDPAAFRLRVDGLVRKPLALSLDDLRRGFPHRRVTALLQCAGNRRDELMAIEPIPGEIPWGAEAVGNAEWGGVRLADVLREAGIRTEAARHVAFAGADVVAKGSLQMNFGGSVPLDKALGDEVLLAWEVNGEPLTPEHGRPLRAVVPGYIGARSVKWLSAVTVQAEPSDNYYQTRAYKRFPPDVRAETADWSRGEMLGPLPVDAVILEPVAGTSVGAGTVSVRGYAVGGHGDGVEAVEVSADGGRTWPVRATLDARGTWAWTLWAAELDLPPGHYELAVRAWDGQGRTQPADAAPLWNFKGYMNNAWHRAAVTVR